MKKINIVTFLLSVLIMILPLQSYADCIYDGYSYPTGTKLGDLTCQPDGTWK